MGGTLSSGSRSCETTRAALTGPREQDSPPADIQWQLAEFSRVEKRQSAANPSPPEDEFASFYVTTALYDLVLLLIEADAQTRRAPRHTQIHNTHMVRSWTDILLSTFIRFRASTPVFFKSFCGRGTLVTPECRRWSARALAATPLSCVACNTFAPCPVTPLKNLILHSRDSNAKR